MSTSKLVRSTVTCSSVVLLAALTLLGVDRLGRGSRVSGPAGTLQAPQVAKKIVDRPEEAYGIWKEAGYRGRTVVFVSDRWESFDPGELIPTQMFRAYPLQLFRIAKLLEDEHLDAVTFLYVASMNRMIRGIVAVLPKGEVDRLKQLSAKSKDSKVSDRGLYQTRQGFPRWFTTGADFAGLHEPALLYVGASYFKSSEPEELLAQIAKSGLQSDCVILCREKGKGGVTPAEVAKLNRFARLLGLATPPAGAEGMPASQPQLQPSTRPDS